MAARIGDGSEEIAGVEVERVNSAIAEISDKQRIVELTEALKGRPSHSPRRVKLSLTREPLHKVSFRIENVDKPVARASDIVLFIVVLEGISHIKSGVDGCNTE